MRAISLLVLCIAAVSAVPRRSNDRIFGGSLTTIDNYPEMVVLLSSTFLINFSQECGGSILNQRHILSAAHCCNSAVNNPARCRIRVGSSFAHSGGVVHNINEVILHPNFNWDILESDISVIRLTNLITYSDTAQPAIIAGPNYNVPDNQVVWAAGWGFTEFGGISEQLRDVQIWTINQNICAERYAPRVVSDNMLCSGWLDVGIRDQCGGDSGSPLYHNGVVIGVCSWGYTCGSAVHPGVNARVSRFANWIQSIANQQ